MSRRIWSNIRQITAVMLILFGLLYLLVQVRYAPLVREIATLSIENRAAGIINASIDEAIANGELAYDRLISLEKDQNGDISALRTNMAEVNRLKTSILAAIGAKIEDIDSEELSIPAGTVLLPELFSGHGPLIPVRILTVTASNASFSGHFSEAGINQTRHQISITISIQVTAVTPDGPMEVTVESNAIVAETIIVGRVPQTFFTFDKTTKETEP